MGSFPALRLVGLVVAAFAAVYGLAVLALFIFQRPLLYPLALSDPFLDLAGAERVQVEVPDGTVPMDLSGPAGAPRVAFFHGNAEQIGQTRGDAALAEAQGLAFAAVEYPGYGDAHAGTPNEEAILGAARAALAVLAGKGEPLPVCVGHSLGSGVAVAMAAEGRCHKLVAISAYTSVVDLASAFYPWLPARWLVLDRYDSLGRAPSVTVPALVVHGRGDTLIPAAMGEALAGALPQARFLAVDRGHNDIRDRELWATIGRFIAEP